MNTRKFILILVLHRLLEEINRVRRWNIDVERDAMIS